MKLLVTGGAGFIGSRFVEIAEAHGHACVVVDNLSAGCRENTESHRASLIIGDIAQQESWARLDTNFDAIVHLAAETHVDRSISEPQSFVGGNVMGTLQALEFMRATGVPRMLLVSTDEVYGSIANGAWTESSPLEPRSPYSASKAAADLLALSYTTTYGLDISVTRCSNNYGPRQLPEKLIPRFVNAILAGNEVPVYGDGSNVRDWLHVDDHCRGLMLALEHGRAGRVYNIGGGTELSNLDLTYKLLSSLGVGAERITFVPDRPGHDQRYALDWSRAAEELGYQPVVDFAEGLHATITWYLEHRDWVESAHERALALAGSTLT